MTYPTPGHREPGDPLNADDLAVREAIASARAQTAASISARTGSEAWADTVRLQRWTPKADHHDFYALAGEVVSTVEQLGELVTILRAQAADYPTTGRLFDDTRGVSPTRRIAASVVELERAQVALATAEAALNGFWSAIGHIGVEES